MKVHNTCRTASLYPIFFPSNRREREAYYVRRAEGVTNPSKILSLILDGMDQSKTTIPRFQGTEAPKVLVSFIYLLIFKRLDLNYIVVIAGISAIYFRNTLIIY